MRSIALDADILIVGAGPAGTAAALMAGSLGQRTIVVEANRVGHKLYGVGALDNVAGGWSSGPQLAQALTADLERLQAADRCRTIQACAGAVATHDDHAILTLTDGRALSAQTIVIATGVAELPPSGATWLSSPEGYSPPPLWRAIPGDLIGETFVLGADRPLGTWLRTYPDASVSLRVLCPPADGYKVAEVADDARVQLIPISRAVVAPAAVNSGWTVTTIDALGQQQIHEASTVLNNLGSRPVGLDGLARGEDGYCPPELQSPHVRVAGDLRSARFQRISIAQGSGAEAVLADFYLSRLAQPIREA